MTKGIHRVVAGTKSARQIMAQSLSEPPRTQVDKQTQAEIKAWNKAIDAKKSAKR